MTKRKASGIRITPKGYAVLRAVERGTYKFKTRNTAGPRDKRTGRFIHAR